MVAPLLSFTATEVEAATDEYTSDFIVHVISFAVGDSEADGHCWHFSRCFDDDEGVETVREPQRAVLYDEIASFHLHRSGLECVFDPKGAAETGFVELRIQFEIDDRAWQELAAKARIVFQDCAYFTCAE